MSVASSDDKTIASNARYVYFDFHTECRKMRFDRISLLVDQLKTPLGEMGWFHSSTSAVAQQGQGQAQGQAQGLEGQQTKVKQSGVVRSNCMDCLDRTNVSQSALGKWAATEQLRSVGVLNEKEKIEDFPEFMDMFRAGALIRLQLSRIFAQNNRRTVIAQSLHARCIAFFKRTRTVDRPYRSSKLTWQYGPTTAIQSREPIQAPAPSKLTTRVPASGQRRAWPMMATRASCGM